MRPPCNLVPLGIRASSAVLLGAALPGGRVPGGPHGAGRDRHSWPHRCAAGKTPPPASPPLLWPVRPGAQSWGAVSASSAKTAGAAKPASCPDHVTRQSPGSRCSGPPPAGSQPASGPGAPRTWLWPLGVNEDASSVLAGSGQAAGPEDTAGPGPPLAPLLCRAPGPCRPQACTGWAARVSALPAGAGACSQRRQASRKAATVPERAATVSARDRLHPEHARPAPATRCGAGPAAGFSVARGPTTGPRAAFSPSVAPRAAQGSRHRRSVLLFWPRCPPPAARRSRARSQPRARLPRPPRTAPGLTTRLSPNTLDARDPVRAGQHCRSSPGLPSPPRGPTAGGCGEQAGPPPSRLDAEAWKLPAPSGRRLMSSETGSCSGAACPPT